MLIVEVFLIILFLLGGFFLIIDGKGDELSSSNELDETPPPFIHKPRFIHKKPQLTTLMKTAPPFEQIVETPNPADLSLTISDPDYELCCGMVPTKLKIIATPNVKNVGDETAHNVKIRFELFSGTGKRIKVNGEEYIERWLGNLAGGASITETVEFTIGLRDGYELQDNGVKSVYNIYSDENSKQIIDEFTF
jgi:hypothetical protein